MNLWDKIEEIRQKPEHIRLRYVYALTAVSALFIIIIWFFSIKARMAEAPSSTDDGVITHSITEGKKSIEDATLEMKNSLKNAQNQAQNIREGAGEGFGK